MWQSQVEIKHYSAVYFDHITAFETLYCRTSVKGTADTCCVNVVSFMTLPRANVVSFMTLPRANVVSFMTLPRAPHFMEVMR